ncbi:Tripartite DNA replication factor [Phlyctochytrium planicorne]|nr:Tripartite DNA replication factor [Phlyctochytrium planicorne]
MKPNSNARPFSAGLEEIAKDVKTAKDDFWNEPMAHANHAADQQQKPSFRRLVVLSFYPGSGDCIVVHCDWASQDIIIDQGKNLLITDPDVLVSATQLADSFSCLRRSILQEKARVSSESNSSLVYGNLLHQIFQACLVKMDFSVNVIEREIDAILKKSVADLYNVSLTESAARQFMIDYIPNLQKWSAEHLKGQEGMPTKVISKVLDIEEHIWSPMFGLKGNIDATVIISDNEAKSHKITPLEFKTGQARSSSHRAQTILYTQLLTDKYSTDVEQGMLQLRNDPRSKE